MDHLQNDDLQRDDFIEAKRRLPADVIRAIVAEREMFLDPELGQALAPLGAAREKPTAGEGEPREWMVEPEFRAFLRRSV